MCTVPNCEDAVSNLDYTDLKGVKSFQELVENIDHQSFQHSKKQSFEGYILFIIGIFLLTYLFRTCIYCENGVLKNDWRVLR